MRIRIGLLIGACTLLTVGIAGDANAMSLKRLTAPSSACPNQNESSLPVAQQERAMRCMIGYARQKANRGRLDSAAKLNTSAADKAGDILRCDQFSHEACGRDFLYWIDRVGYSLGRCWRAGENIAWGSGELGTVRSIMKAWLHSPPHRVNMLSPAYDQFGVGLSVGDLAGTERAHIWVTHLGSHC
jgi:uncharacterized protein YkwD